MKNRGNMKGKKSSSSSNHHKNHKSDRRSVDSAKEQGIPAKTSTSAADVASTSASTTAATIVSAKKDNVNNSNPTKRNRPFPERKLELYLILLTCVAFVAPLFAKVMTLFPQLGKQLAFSIVVSIVVGFYLTYKIIPYAGAKIIDTLSGVDIGKRGLGYIGDGLPIPESMGLISGTLFLVCIIFTQAIYGHGDPSLLLDYQTALLAICFTMLLGLADDVMDLKWSQKLVIGVIASIPLCASYDGPTAILIPNQLRFFLVNQQSKQRTIIADLLELFNVHVPVEASGGLVDLGWVYLLYMLLLAVFCTNAVNIYAGINGLGMFFIYIYFLF